jgi:hypothetical protein
MAKPPRIRKTHCAIVAFVACALMLGVAGPASAATVSLRVELPGQALVPLADVTLPNAPVAGPGAGPGQTCSGNSVIAALATATGGDWGGQWSAANGWSLDTIKGTTIQAGEGRRWDVYVNDNYVNDQPCWATLADQDKVLIFPRCTTAAIGCFSEGPLSIEAAAQASPKGHPTIQLWEVSTYFDGTGRGTSTRAPSTLAGVSAPGGNTQTDQYYGVANVSLSDGGPNLVTATKGNHVPGRAIICVTDGNDGYCGTTVPDHNPFDALAFCVTTGDDGECNTVDKRPPIGHINTPGQGKVYTVKSALKFLRGTVDRDPSEVTGVKLRLKRQLTVKVKKLVKKKTVKDKKTGKRKVKKTYKTVSVKRCYGWKVSLSDWGQLKSCTAEAGWFKADGDEIWSFEFLFAMPKGLYTLDAQATDGKGNVDSAIEVGRNRVSFTIK